MKATAELCKQCGKLTLGGGLVVVEKAEYERLLSAQALSVPPVQSRSRLAREPEILAFLLAELPRKTVKEVVDAVRQRFGNDAPSKSAIYRFVGSLRRSK